MTPKGTYLRDGVLFRAGRRIWTELEDAALRRLYPDTPTHAIATRLKRPLLSVYHYAAKLGLRKSENYLASPAACRLRRGDNVGAAYRFKKGQTPANKGLRRPGWSAGRMKETQFKPGMRSGKAAELHMPVGSTRLVDGYVYRKVSDVPNVAYTVNWKPEHHLLWVANRGPIPPGHALVFKNRNRMDITLDNLELVTRRQLMAMNTVHNLPPELATTIHLLGALNREIRRRSNAEE